MDLDQIASFLQCKTAIIFINLSVMIFQLSMHKNIHSNDISPCPLLDVIVSLVEVGLLGEWLPRGKEKRRLRQSSGMSIFTNS